MQPTPVTNSNPQRLPKPVDLLSIAFLAGLMALTLINYSTVPGAAGLSARYAGVIALIYISSWARRNHPDNRLLLYVNELMPIFVIMFTFDSLSSLTQYVNNSDMDPALANADLALFGVHPGVFMQVMIHPALTTVLQLCYLSYYFLPITLGLMLLFAGETDRFDRAVFGIVLGFFASYVGYLLVPALGPRHYIADAFTADLMRSPLAAGINDTLNMLEGENRDAFPSGHTEIVLIVLFYAWVYRRWFFWVSLPLVSGLIFSTVYLRYHYVVDVLAGVVLAPLCVWAATAIYGWYEKKAGG